MPTAIGQNPTAIDCLPFEHDMAKIKAWCVFVIAKEITEYHQGLKKFSGVIKYGNQSIKIYESNG